MVEYAVNLDTLFHSLSDPTRRDMLRRVSGCDLSVGQLVECYDVSFAAVSKHLKVLETAGLVSKRKEGRHHIVSLEVDALKKADTYLEQYRCMWEGRYKKLDKLLT